MEESNLINKHALNREPVPVILTVYCPGVLAMYIVNCGTSTPSSDELAPRNFEKKKLQNYQWNMELLICSWLYGGHVGWQEQKRRFPTPGTFFFFHASSAKKEKNLIFLSTNKANLESKRKANQQGYSSKNLKKCHYYYRPKHLNSNTHKLILDNWKFKSTRNCFFFNFIFTVFLIFFLELFRQFSGNSTIHYSTTQRAIPGVKRHVHLNMQINEFHRFHWPVSSWDSSASLMAKYLARWSTTKKK